MGLLLYAVTNRTIIMYIFSDHDECNYSQEHSLT